MYMNIFIINKSYLFLAVHHFIFSCNELLYDGVLRTTLFDIERIYQVVLKLVHNQRIHCYRTTMYQV